MEKQERNTDNLQAAVPINGPPFCKPNMLPNNYMHTDKRVFLEQAFFC